MAVDTLASPELKKLLDGIPANIRDSFSADQLGHLDKAMSDSRHVIHPVDIRGTLNIWRFRYYFVFLAGRDRRALSRRQEKLFRRTELSVLFGFLSFSLLFGILVLYLIKSAMGIDIFPNFSFGIWHWFKAEYL